MKLNLLLGSIAAALLTSGAREPRQVQYDHDSALTALEVPALVYITYKTSGDTKIEIDAQKWATDYNGRDIDGDGRGDGGGREDIILKLWSANTRAKSTHGLRHAGCFRGFADEIQEGFFDESNPAHKLPGSAAFTVHSSDGQALGIRFRHSRLGEKSFRLSRCDTGKTQVTGSAPQQDEMQRGGGVGNGVGPQAPINHVVPPQPPGKVTAPATAKGFVATDILTAPPANLPTFALRADYDNSRRDAGVFPWRGLNLRDKKQALKAALLLQKYFYENMANQNPTNPDMNFIAQNNSNRYWCHVPWLNVGPNGREAVHGLTKELDLKPTQKIAVYSAATPGSNWGVAYFNAPGCETLGEVFGSSTNPLAVPAWDKSQFKDGTVSVKILFTSSNFPAIANAYRWKANVSGPGQTERSLQTVRHIQMDISVKDKNFVGLMPRLNNWTMFGFYYDPDYDFDKELRAELGEDSPLKGMNLPEGLRHMRPMGVQTGFDTPATGDTILFGSAQANGAESRLNGPADNPRSSCMGCHATAGHSVSMVPGFLDEKTYDPFHDRPNLDFNQQVALARRNFETELGK